MTDWGWISRQAGEAELPDEIYASVVELLRVLDTRNHTDDERKEVLDKLLKLAMGHSIIVPKKNERWGPVVPGYYSVKDTVRVRKDAYDGEKGQKHNGKRGRVIAARDGFVLVVYEDALSADIQHRHLPEKLQRLT